MSDIRACLVLTAALLGLCSGAYPAAVTVAARAIFPRQASGSLIEQGGKVIGSELLGQPFDKPELYPGYFWARPSAASIDSATGIVSSSGSNHGPMSPSLEDEVKARIEALRAAGVAGPIPVDLVTRSASGLDPHISPAAAELQVPRVAHARHLPEGEVKALLAAHTEGRTLGLLGEPRVHVLRLNLALDQRTGSAPPPPATSPAAPLAPSAPSPSAAPPASASPPG